MNLSVYSVYLYDPLSNVYLAVLHAHLKHTHHKKSWLMNRLSLNPSQCNIFTKPVSRILCLHFSKYCYLWCEMTVMQDKVVSIPTKEHPRALYLLYWEKNIHIYFSMLLHFCVLASLLNRKRKCTALWWGNSTILKIKCHLGVQEYAHKGFNVHKTHRRLTLNWAERWKTVPSV